MTSLNDPGKPGNGAERPVEQSDLPPWQRAERRRGNHSAATGPVAVPGREPRPGGAPTEIIPVFDPEGPPPRPSTPPPPPPGRPSAGLDARLSRFISGTSAPPAFATPVRSVEDHDPEPTESFDSHEPPELEAPEPVVEREEAPRADPPWSEAESIEPARVSKNADLPDLSGPVPRRPKPLGGQADPAVTVSPRRRGPLRASMQIRRIDPWATLKVSLVLSVVFFFVWMIAVALLYVVLGAMGVWSKLNENVGELITNSGGGELVSAGTIFGYALLIGLVNIVLMTAAATIGAFIYNLTTDLVGGIEVTLADRD